MLENNLNIRVLMHFNNRDKINLRFTAQPGITENEFLLKILDRMTLDGLLGIYKMNISQFVETEADVLPFLNICEGEASISKNDLFSQKFDEVRQSLIRNYNENDENDEND